jgi:ParB-like chromosome segregation protein Spo0J/DNA-binding XRE family transcriptional regulator
MNTMIPTAQLIHDNYRALDQEKVATVAADMKANGFDALYAIHVVKVAEGWRVVNGHHRSAAAAAAGLELIPALILDEMSERELLARQLRDNMAVRQDDDVTLAETFQRQIQMGETVETIAANISRTTSYVRNRLALMDLDPYVRGIIAQRGLSYATFISHLSPNAQVECVKELARQPEWNREQWRRYVELFTEEWNAKVDAGSSMFDLGSLAVQTWSEELAAYVTDERETEKALASIPAAPMGLAEIATYINASRQTVYAWRKRGKLPAADITLAIGELWHVTTIDAWRATLPA